MPQCQGWPPLAEVLLDRCAACFDDPVTATQELGLVRVALTAVQALEWPEAMRRYEEVLTITASRARFCGL